MLSLHNLRSSSNTPETSRRSDNTGLDLPQYIIASYEAFHYKEDYPKRQKSFFFTFMGHFENEVNVVLYRLRCHLRIM